MNDSRIPNGFNAFSINPNALPSIGYPEALTPYGTILILKGCIYHFILYIDVFGCPATWNSNDGRWNVIKTAHV